MHAVDEAFIVHRTPTRIRMKIPHRQRQEAYFAALKRDVTKHPDVVAVHVNVLTASMVVQCGNSLELLRRNPRFGGLELFEGGRSLPDSPPACSVRADDLNDPYTGAIGLVAILIKIIVAIATKQIGAQLIEWVVAVAAQSARREAAATAARRRPLRARPVHVLVQQGD